MAYPLSRVRIRTALELFDRLAAEAIGRCNALATASASAPVSKVQVTNLRRYLNDAHTQGQILVNGGARALQIIRDEKDDDTITAQDVVDIVTALDTLSTWISGAVPAGNSGTVWDDVAQAWVDDTFSSAAMAPFRTRVTALNATRR